MKRVDEEAGHDKPSGNTWLWPIVGSLLGLVLLYASTRQVDFAALLDSLRSVRWGWTLGILAATASFIAIKTWRWAVLLRFVPGVRFRELHSAVYVGLAVNYLISHAGEFLRAGLVARRHRAPVGAVFATVLVERVLDFIALLALIALVFVSTPNVPDVIQIAAAIAGGFVAVAIAGLHLMLHTPAWLRRLSSTLGSPLPQRLRTSFAQQLERSRAGLVAIRDLRLMLSAILVSVAQWSLVVVAIWCSALAVGGSTSLTAAMTTFVLIVLGLTLPNSPLQLGTTQLAFAVGLGVGGMAATTAVAASLIYTAFLILPIMLAGSVLVLRGRLAPGVQIS